MTVVSESGFTFGFGGWMITYSVESIGVGTGFGNGVWTGAIGITGTGTGIGIGSGFGLVKSLINLKWAIVMPYVSDGPSPLNYKT